MKEMRYMVIKKVSITGWPYNAPNYEPCHREASNMEIMEFGDKDFVELEEIAIKLPNDELLGKHTKHGQIFISSRVPVHLREEVWFHERMEHELMIEKRNRK